MSANRPRAPVSVLVLTRNEEANIETCLRSVSWAGEVFVVDSFSNDRTVEIAHSMGARIYRHEFGTCASQWNWALDNLPFSNEWIFILDADERIPQPLAEEITRIATDPAQKCSGFYVKFRLWFMGRWLRHGGLYPTWIIRFFKRNAGRFGRHGASEHLILEGRKGYLQAPFDHCDNKPLSDWIQKHNRYAELEAAEYLRRRGKTNQPLSIAARFGGSQAERKQWIRLKIWNRLPLLLRPCLFFFRNYFLKFGFLDGRPGLIYHVLWSFWVRFLIDVRIFQGQTGQDAATTRERHAASELGYSPTSRVCRLEKDGIHGYAGK